jgi:hypothetical protein
MKTIIGSLAAAVAAAAVLAPSLCLVAADVSDATTEAISTPDRVETRIGTLDFKDGMPSAATLEKVYDNLDRAHALEAFVNTMQGVNAAAIRKGFLVRLARGGATRQRPTNGASPWEAWRRALLLLPPPGLLPEACKSRLWSFDA